MDRKGEGDICSVEDFGFKISMQRLESRDRDKSGKMSTEINGVQDIPGADLDTFLRRGRRALQCM